MEQPHPLFTYATNLFGVVFPLAVLFWPRIKKHLNRKNMNEEAFRQEIARAPFPMKLMHTLARLLIGISGATISSIMAWSFFIVSANEDQKYRMIYTCLFALSQLLSSWLLISAVKEYRKRFGNLMKSMEHQNESKERH